jgi:hypothetical protein
MYKVTIAIDYLDTDPTIKIFDFFDEAQDFITEEVSLRVQWFVDHSPYMISEEEREHQEEIEYTLVRLEEVEKVDA